MILPLISFLCFGKEPIQVPVEKVSRDSESIGKLHSPLGTMIKVVGVVVEGEFKGYEGGLNLRVQKIQERYYQDDIQILLKPKRLERDTKSDDDKGILSELKIGETYEMEGYESGEFVGMSEKARKRMKVIPQTTGRYFRHEFVVIKVKLIDAISYSPGMFSEQKALMSGLAKSIDGNSVLVGDGWSVVVKRGEKWAYDIEGKKIESYGLYKPDLTEKIVPNIVAKKFDLVDGWCRLVELEDQIGKKVCLRGMARSTNGHWWFHYRGIDLDVENMDKLPGWTVDNHWRSMELEGRLELVKPPSPQQIADDPDRASSNKFIIREPSWKPLPALLTTERAFPPRAAKKR
jgi:hypothetical protein